MWSRLIYGKADMPYNYSEFICDEESDIATLPTTVHLEYNSNCEHCSVGSRAYVVETNNSYILNNKNEWKLIKDKTSIAVGQKVDEKVNEVFTNDTFIFNGNVNEE